MIHPHLAGAPPRILIASLITLAAVVLTWLMIIDALLTFIPTLDRRNPIVRFLRSITEPIYRPLRKVIPAIRVGDAGMDLSPLIAIIAIRIIAGILANIIAG